MKLSPSVFIDLKGALLSGAPGVHTYPFVTHCSDSSRCDGDVVFSTCSLILSAALTGCTYTRSTQRSCEAHGSKCAIYADTEPLSVIPLGYPRSMLHSGIAALSFDARQKMCRKKLDLRGEYYAHKPAEEDVFQ